MEILTSENLGHQAEFQLKDNLKLIKTLKRTKPKSLDKDVSTWHDKAFETIDCLQCANCCKTTSPRFQQVDIQRLAKHLKMKPSAFINSYLHLDEDGDYVFPKPPCPFLLEDNSCLVYNHRPTACREYPHTDRKRFVQILDISLQNTKICPAVFGIFERLKEKYMG
ncbi:MAG: YkgJ family cysteine cluster protein [Cyclobacteriaceae bacterium]